MLIEIIFKVDKWPLVSASIATRFPSIFPTWFRLLTREGTATFATCWRLPWSALGTRIQCALPALLSWIPSISTWTLLPEYSYMHIMQVISSFLIEFGSCRSQLARRRARRSAAGAALLVRSLPGLGSLKAASCPVRLSTSTPRWRIWVAQWWEAPSSNWSKYIPLN